MTGMKIVGSGRALPSRLVPNSYFAEFLDTSDEWIKSRTGIETRYFAEDETNWQLASEAAKEALKDAGISGEELGAVIVATFTPDYATPAVACNVQEALGIQKEIPCFDVNSACSGFVYGLKVAGALMPELDGDYVLLIGSEIVSRMMDMSDRATCVLFGDGAGAVVLKRDDSSRFYCRVGAKGNKEVLHCGGANTPDPFIRMDGTAVFKFAVDAGGRALDAVLSDAGLTLSDIDYVICHQANKRIIDFIGKTKKIPPEKLYTNVNRYANTVAATIPICIDELRKQGKLKKGAKAVCLGFGSGLSYGGALLEF